LRCAADLGHRVCYTLHDGNADAVWDERLIRRDTRPQHIRRQASVTARRGTTALQGDLAQPRACASIALLQARVRLLQEANLWRKLKSKDIVKLIGIGARDLSTFDSITSSMYMVCEYMEGGTLREIVERQMLSSKKQVYAYSDVFRCAAPGGCKAGRARQPALARRLKRAMCSLAS
jgi:serine/threonine protein kinase